MNDPKFCKDCKYSKPADGSAWELRCHNPKVNKDDPWALSQQNTDGTNCSIERKLSAWFWNACSKSGKLFEPKE